MHKWRVLHGIMGGFMLWFWIACSKPANAPGSSGTVNLNSVETQIAGTWRLVSKIDSSVLTGNILSTTTYSNFTYSPVIIFGTLVDNTNLNPVAKTYSYKGVNIGPVFAGAPDSTLHGKGTWYYDLGNKSIYLNFGRYGFSMTNNSLMISVISDVSPILTNTWVFAK